MKPDPPPPPKKKKQEEIVVLVLVVYDRCRSRGRGGGLLPCMAYTGLCFWTEYGVLPPPPRLPLGADMLEMTTDAQEGSNKTLQGLINTMQSHSVVMRFEITMIFY